jgi:surfeit locus 1 family protein
MGGMLRLLRSPRWVAGHVVVLVAVITFANLGAWQLRRLEERRAYNALLTERLAQPPVPVEDLLDADPDAVAYRRVTAAGTFAVDDEVLLSTRSQAGRPGHHVLTPLDLGDVRLVVDRGWVPLDVDGPPVREAPPPPGSVTVEGVLFPAAQARRHGAFDGAAEPLQFVSDVDLDVLGASLDGPVAPLWLLSQAQAPPSGGDLPMVAALPELTEGSHRSYAAQWFLFALVVVIGYPVLLWRTHRDQRDAAADTSSSASAPPPVGAAHG